MDVRGRCKDNVWGERFWRIAKQEHIHLNPAESVEEPRLGIDQFILFYNSPRPHQSIDVLLQTMKYDIAA